ADSEPRQSWSGPVSATVVIPNWNGRDLLARYLPPLETALAGNDVNEILVVDNGSTDGSVESLRNNFPRVKVLALDRNLGFGGGGSCAFDRRKFLELGGFDPLLAPFYLEDTDLGYMAWKRGWKVLYQPKSVVYHEHRGTIGKRFTEQQIQAVLKKNFILFC